jgi:hypothetical protein
VAWVSKLDGADGQTVRAWFDANGARACVAGPEGKQSDRSHVITQALGGSEFPLAIVPQVSVGWPMHLGDRFLLCTDGLTDALDDSDLSVSRRPRLPSRRSSSGKRSCATGWRPGRRSRAAAGSDRLHRVKPVIPSRAPDQRGVWYPARRHGTSRRPRGGEAKARRSASGALQGAVTTRSAKSDNVTKQSARDILPDRSVFRIICFLRSSLLACRADKQERVVQIGVRGLKLGPVVGGDGSGARETPLLSRLGSAPNMIGF